MRPSAWHAALAVSLTAHAAALGAGTLPFGRPPTAPEPGRATDRVHLRVVTPGAAGDAPSFLTDAAASPPEWGPEVTGGGMPEPIPLPHIPSIARSLEGPEPAARYVPTAVAMHARPPTAGAVRAAGTAAAEVPAVAASVPVDSVPAKPVMGTNPPPRYPQIARRNGWEGTVLLDADINRTGRVTAVRVAASSGHVVLDEAAADAVAAWQFIPASAGGVPLEATVRVPVVFRLDEPD